MYKETLEEMLDAHGIAYTQKQLSGLFDDLDVLIEDEKDDAYQSGKQTQRDLDYYNSKW